MTGSVKTTHTLGVHPNVVAEVFGIHLRSVFRHFECKRLEIVPTNSKLALRSNVLDLLTLLYVSCSQKEARKKLRVTQGTFIDWRRRKVLETVTVLSEERFHLASVQAVRSMPNYKRRGKHILFTLGLSEESRYKVLEQVWMKTDNLRSKIEAEAEEQARKKLHTAIEEFRRTEMDLYLHQRAKREKRAEEFRKLPNLRRWEKALRKKKSVELRRKPSRLSQAS